MSKKIKLLKLKPIYIVSILAALILSSCESCGCNTTCEGPTANRLSVFGGGWQKVEVFSQCYQKCSSLASDESGITDHSTKLFFVNLFDHKVIEVSDTYLDYDSVSSFQIITDSMAYAHNITKEGDQLYLWNYETPVYEVGSKWLQNGSELENRKKNYSDSIPFPRWEKSYVDKNYYTYSYSWGSKFRESDTLNVFFRVDLKTGEAGPFREEGGRDISQWNNVVYAFGDFYGIDTKSLDTAYIYKYDMEAKMWDSLFIDINKEYESDWLDNTIDVTFSFDITWDVNPLYPYNRETDLVIPTIRGFYGIVINTSDFSIKYTGRLNYESTNAYISMENDKESLRLHGYYDSIPVDITYKDWKDWGADGMGVVNIPENDE